MIGTQRGEELKAMIMMRKRGRTILARCDSDAAIKVGRQLGITLFQGRYIDGLVRTGIDSLTNRQPGCCPAPIIQAK